MDNFDVTVEQKEEIPFDEISASDNYLDAMDESFRNIYHLTLNALKPIVKDKELELFTPLSEEEVKEFLDSEQIDILFGYKEQLVNVFSLVKYISLFNDMLESLDKVTKAVQKLFDSESDVSYTIYRNFNSEISFVSDKKPGSYLLVNFRFLDSEATQPIFIIGKSATAAGWEVTGQELKAFVTGKLSANSYSKELPKTTTSSDPISVLCVNGVKITVEKQ